MVTDRRRRRAAPSRGRALALAALAALAAACGADDGATGGVLGTAVTAAPSTVPTTAATTAPPTTVPPTTVPPTTVPPTTAPPTTAPPTTAPPTTVPPTTVPVATGTGAEGRALRVLLLGDGIVWDAEPALLAALAVTGPVEVRSEPFWGFGLTRPQWRDWPRLWPTYVAEFAPDAVVVTTGPNDLAPIGIGSGRLAGPGEPGWASVYAALLDDAAGALDARGARIYWVAMLPQAPPAPGTPAQVAALNAELAALADRRPSVTLVDPTDEFADDGHAVVVTHAGLRLRKVDGEHLCAEGAARWAEAAVAAVAPDWDRVVADPGWRDGPWRADGRYGWDGGPGCAT